MSALRCLTGAQSSVSKTEFLIILLKTYSSQSFRHLNERRHPFSYSAKDLGVISFPHTSYTKPLANPVTCTLEYRCTQQNVFLVNIFLIEFLLVFNTNCGSQPSRWSPVILNSCYSCLCVPPSHTEQG